MTADSGASRSPSPRESVDRMVARGARVALVAYARTLQDALKHGTPVAVLVEEGIPLDDIRRAFNVSASGEERSS